jgi:hypothetical protein
VRQVARIAGLVSLANSAARNLGECSGNSAMFLVTNSTSEGTAVANVSCEILNSCVRMLYNADKRCRGNRSRMDAGIAHLRGHGEVRNITFQLSGTAPSTTSTAVMVNPISTSLLTTADAASAWSRAFVFGISNVNSTIGVAVHLNSGSARVTASDYAS